MNAPWRNSLMNIEEVPPTQIAVLLKQAMDEEKLSLNDLAKEFGLTYEYMRRVARGLNTPSKTILCLFAQRFKWNFKEVEALLVQDRFRLRNGEAGAIAQTFNPEVEPFEKAWHLLGPEQKKILLQQFQLILAQNRRYARGGDNTPLLGKRDSK